MRIGNQPRIFRGAKLIECFPFQHYCHEVIFLFLPIAKITISIDTSKSFSDYTSSKQYASRNNLAWFNGHFETFAGFEAGIGKRSKIALNLVNVLWQNGAKGSVDIVDTVEDPAILQNYLISGTYIRPFSMELSYTVKF